MSLKQLMVSNDSSQNRRCHHHWGTIQLLQMKPLPRRRSRTPTIWLQKKIVIWFRSRLKAPNVPITVAKQILGQFARFVLNRSAVCTWASITEVPWSIQNSSINRDATSMLSPLVQIVLADNAVAKHRLATQAQMCSRPKASNVLKAQTSNYQTCCSLSRRPLTPRSPVEGLVRAHTTKPLHRARHSQTLPRPTPRPPEGPVRAHTRKPLQWAQRHRRPRPPRQELQSHLATQTKLWQSTTTTSWKMITIWSCSRPKASNVPTVVARKILGQFAKFVLNRFAVCTWASITEVARRIQNFTNNRGATTFKSPLVQIVVADNAVAAVLQAVAHYRTAIVRVARHHLVTSLPRTSKRTKLFRTKDQSLMLQHAKMTLWHKSRRSFAPSAENAYLKQ